ncbi:hypothetical protein TI39_contig603g00010 [Zymoseptoria brevis]|uniref:Ubiquitin-like domain-containing protein n=1 Tax=Zymoseptoria brevis TaxID=1047168 RepID=A0A0F4GGZ8_9PEZI|nr:hypothetical protein TI39_contig603g00010 [Zymoseptoria brevis]
MATTLASFRVNVKLPNGKTVAPYAASSDTIMGLKSQIQLLSGIPAVDLLVLYPGAYCKDDRTLAQNTKEGHPRIQHVSTIPQQPFTFYNFLLITMAVFYPTTSSFHIPWLTSHQPNGTPSGSTNFYNLIFNITSPNASPAQSGYCGVSWSDNLRDCHYRAEGCVPYSTEVPTKWIECWTNQSVAWSVGNRGAFSFKLAPYFGIGNFSIEVQEKVPDRNGVDATVVSNPYLITNTSAAVFACDILESESSPSWGVGQHARGDCKTPAGTDGFFISVAETLY